MKNRLYTLICAITAVFFLGVVSLLPSCQRSRLDKTSIDQGPLIVFNAGSLTAPVADLLREFAQRHSQVVPQQESSGSLEAARKITELGKPCDILAVADYEVIPSLVMPQHVDWYIEALVDIPIVIPHPVAGIALLLVFGRQFFGGRFFSNFGLTFVGDVPGIIAAMLFVSAPFLINAARDGFLRVDPRLENVARTLGYGPLRAFFRVSLPLSWRDLLSGAIMMWARAISEFGSIVIITYNPKVASVLIYDRFTTYGLAYALPVAIVLVLICLFVFALLRGINPRADQVKIV